MNIKYERYWFHIGSSKVRLGHHQYREGVPVDLQQIEESAWMSYHCKDGRYTIEQLGAFSKLLETAWGKWVVVYSTEYYATSLENTEYRMFGTLNEAFADIENATGYLVCRADLQQAKFEALVLTEAYRLRGVRVESYEEIE